MRSQDFMELRAFELVSRRLSFSRAAEDLGMSRGALSALVKNFEKRLGIQLLIRTTRSVTLTDAGEQLLERLSPALQELVRAVAHMDEFRQRPRGRIRLLTCQIGAELCLRHIVPAFSIAEPDVILDIQIESRPATTWPQGVDAAIRIEGAIDRDLLTVPMCAPSRLVLVASDNYIQRHGRPAALDDLRGHSWIEVSGGSVGLGSLKALGLTHEDMHPRTVLASDDYRFALDMARQDLGICLIPEILLQELGWTAVEQILPDIAMPLAAYHLCYPAHLCASPAFRSFTEFVRKQVVGVLDSESSGGIASNRVAVP
jgi:DNA-binding transcriptional LysR family regulator